MNKEFKKNFFTCLLAVLLVVSNLIGKKYTIFMDMAIGVDFVTFPFTFLCTLLILNLGDKKDAYRSILSASVIQLLITISYTIAINLGSQSIIADQGPFVNEIFKVNQFNILSSVLTFMLSHCLLIYIYENFKHFNKELYGIIIGLLGALFLNSVMFVSLTLKGLEFMIIINTLIGNIIVDIVMIFIITIIFYILKEHKKEVLVIKEEGKETKDLGLDEVINNKSKKVNKTVKKKNNNYNKRNNNTNYKNSSKKTSTSKKRVNKENK